jgi:hypothetical protein
MSEDLGSHRHLTEYLESHSRAFYLAAAEHEEAAERERGRKSHELSRMTRPPAEALARLDAAYDRRIEEHERMARVSRRRAETAADGYLLAGPDEGRDADYQRRYADLIGQASRAGRLRIVTDSVAVVDELHAAPPRSDPL